MSSAPCSNDARCSYCRTLQVTGITTCRRTEKQSKLAEIAKFVRRWPPASKGFGWGVRAQTPRHGGFQAFSIWVAERLRCFNTSHRIRFTYVQVHFFLFSVVFLSFPQFSCMLFSRRTCQIGQRRLQCRTKFLDNGSTRCRWHDGLSFPCWAASPRGENQWIQHRRKGQEPSDPSRCEVMSVLCFYIYVSFEPRT